MSLRAFLTRNPKHSLSLQNICGYKCYATSAESTNADVSDLTSADIQPQYDDTEDRLRREEELKALRNKSRLESYHRNILYGRRPYDVLGIARHHNSTSYRRRLLGRYGIEGSGVDPGLAWPTPKDVEVLKERERVEYPQTIQEAWKMLEAQKKAEEESIIAREKDIAAKFAKTAQWEKELQAKVAKKQAEIKLAQERKERLVEEVRRHFGFRVDPRDERFKEMLEQKEKEERKRKKEEKKKLKAEKLMMHLLKVDSAKTDGSSEPKNDNAADKKTEVKPPADSA